MYGLVETSLKFVGLCREYQRKKRNTFVAVVQKALDVLGPELGNRPTTPGRDSTSKMQQRRTAKRCHFLIPDFRRHNTFGTAVHWHNLNKVVCLFCKNEWFFSREGSSDDVVVLDGEGNSSENDDNPNYRIYPVSVWILCLST